MRADSSCSWPHRLSLARRRCRRRSARCAGPGHSFLSKPDTVMDMEKYVAIIIPGLGEIERFSLLSSHWRKYHVEPVLHRVGWHGSEHFEARLAKIVARIDSFSTTGTKVSLIGCSAGGSAALNAFLERKNTVHKVISLCGWLRVGEQRWLGLSEQLPRFDKWSACRG
jgi:pimeloyl-ACP methyl ester carboxylesterase